LKSPEPGKVPGVKYILVSKDAEILEQAAKAFYPDDEVLLTGDWQEAMSQIEGTDMMFVDLLATLRQDHKIAGYEEFAEAKLGNPVAKAVKLVMIWPPADYELDFMTGYPDFIFQHIQRPVTFQKLRRSTTFIE
jgi:hypothetical protein